MAGINTWCLPDRSSKPGRYVLVAEVRVLEMTLRNEIVWCSCKKASWRGLLCPQQWTGNFLTSRATKNFVGPQLSKFNSFWNDSTPLLYKLLKMNLWFTTNQTMSLIALDN
jgi:hypothetical protein